jgi:hypothetical protein
MLDLSSLSQFGGIGLVLMCCHRHRDHRGRRGHERERAALCPLRLFQLLAGLMANGYAEECLVGVRGRDNPPLRSDRELKPGGRAAAKDEDTSMHRMNKR